MADPIRVYLLDDHDVVRQGLRFLLEQQEDIEVVGESATATEATARIPALRPDVAVLDARLPDGSGIEVCRAVRAVDPTINALILTSYDDDEALFAAIMAGASGYVLKEIRSSDLVTAVRHVAAGKSLIDPAMTATVLERIRSGPHTPDELASLTDQERILLGHIAEGLTNRQIAEQMFLAEKTVKNYVSSILAKLGLERRTQAAVLASKLLKPSPRRGLSRGWCRPLSRRGGRATRAGCRARPRARPRGVPPRSSARRRALRSPLSETSPGRPHPVVGHPQLEPVGGDGHVDLGAVGEGVPGHVGDRLAQHREQLGAEGLAHHGVHRAGGADDRAEAQHRDVLLDQAADGGAQRLAAAVLELEDRAADGLDGVVELAHRLVESLGDRVVARHGGDALQLQPGREEPLDDDVVEVAGDPLAVGDHRQLLALDQGLGAVEPEGDLVGEAGEQVAVLHVEQSGVGVGDRHQRRHRREVGAQRHDDDRRRRRTGWSGPGRRLGPGLAGLGEDRVRPRRVGVGRHAHGVVVGAERGPQRHRARPGHLARGGDDLVQGGGQLDGGLQQLGELGGGLEPLPAALAQRERAGVADDVARGPRQLLDQALVGLGEGAAARPSR